MLTCVHAHRGMEETLKKIAVGQICEQKEACWSRDPNKELIFVANALSHYTALMTVQFTRLSILSHPLFRLINKIHDKVYRLY